MSASEPRRPLDEQAITALSALLVSHDAIEADRVALHAALGQLDSNAWVSHALAPLSGGQPTRLLLGTTGAFVIAAIRDWDGQLLCELNHSTSIIASRLQDTTGYPDPVRRALWFPHFSSGVEQYVLAAEDENHPTPPVWMVGQPFLRFWLEHYTDRGFTPSEIAHVRMRMAQLRDEADRDRRQPKIRPVRYG